MKRYLRGIASIFVLTALLAVAAYAAESETYDSGLRWALNDAGVLTISGTGPMPGFSYSYVSFIGYSTSAPWFEYRSRITSVVIEDGVTSIGTAAFASCTALTSVSIPATVTSIGRAAFGNCTRLGVLSYGGPRAQWSAVTILEQNEPLDTVTILYNNGPTRGGKCGDDLTWTLDDEGVLTISGRGEMDDQAYLSWSKYRGEITEVVIRYGVTTISDHAFDLCTELGKVSIPRSVTHIGERAFAVTDLTQVVIPNSVLSIGKSAFAVTLIETVTVPGSVATLQESTFASCWHLTDVVIEEGVTTIETEALSNCIRLNSVTIPSSVRSIQKDAFKLTRNVKDIYYDGPLTRWERISIADGNEILSSAGLHTQEPSSATIAVTIVHANGHLSYTEIPVSGGATAYLAVFDRDGRFVSIDQTPADTDKISFHVDESAEYASLCILDRDLVPMDGKVTVRDLAGAR